jgi:hypothetical protein
MNNEINYKFKEYHENNPDVYEKFKEFSIQTMLKGYKTYSAKGIFEIIRWHTGVRGGDTYKVNNNYTPHYARMLMEEVPLFNGFFKTRVVNTKINI